MYTAQRKLPCVSGRLTAVTLWQELFGGNSLLCQMLERGI